MFDLPPPGFHGLDPNKPIQIYSRHLPHWRQEGATYFVTFRLADSLPAERLKQLKEEREIWERTNADASGADRKEFWENERTKVEKWLDQGHGQCSLGIQKAAAILENVLRYFDQDRYSLFGYIVMPNHCHVVVRPHDGHLLEDTIESWKKYSARNINALRGQRGTLWQEEYYDRIVRDTPHLRKVMKYLKKNAKQTNGRQQAWIIPVWREWLDICEDDASGEASSR